ncbi:MAG: hypothetical protein KDD37_01345 [Bdellovibrionales bacterium]|nr:hypothetical protein [Bdellovibrionales bacterium]
MKKQKAVITNNQGSENEVDVEVIHLTTKSRVIKSIQLCFGLLLMALVCVFIPVFHFVLVPTLIILAIVLPFLNLKNDKALTAQKIKCPKCQNQVAFKTKRFQQEVKTFCPECRSQLKLFLKA